MLSLDGQTALCMRVESDRPTPAGKGLGGWFHPLGEQWKERLQRTSIDTLSGSQNQLPDPATLDRVYRHFLDNLELSEAHRKHLAEVRQLSPEQIEAGHYRSWAFSQISRSKLAKTAYERFGAVVLDVPGVIRRNQHGRDYLTLAGGHGIAIPVKNAEGQIVGLKIRPDNGEPAKYYWLSSSRHSGCKPESTVHVARPGRLKDGKQVWLTEGPLKANISAHLLGLIVLGLPGVGADALLPAALAALKARNELDELVIALDEDDNKHVELAKRKLAELAARNGIPTSIASWSTAHKGLDDCLQAGVTPELTPYRVSGNGPRMLEEETGQHLVAPSSEPGPAQPPPKPMTLDQVRKAQGKAMEEFFGHKSQPGEPDVLYLIRSPAGVGKSTAVTEVINECLRRTSKKRQLEPFHPCLFVPRHDLADQPGRERWTKLRGRTHQNDKNPISPCAFPNLQPELTRLRIPASAACEHCPLLTECRQNHTAGQGPYYHGQFRVAAQSGAAVYPSQHLQTPTLWRQATHLIFDDVDLVELQLETVSVSEAEVGQALRWAENHSEHAYAKGAGLLRVLLEMLRSGPYGKIFSWSGPELLKRFLEASKSQEDLQKLLEQARQAKEPDPFHGEDVGLDAPISTPKRFLEPLTEVLRSELKAYQKGSACNRRTYLERTSCHREARLLLLLRRDLPHQELVGKPIMILNASLTVEEAQRQFPQRKIVEFNPSVEMSAGVAIRQHVTCGFGKRQMNTQAGRDRGFKIVKQCLTENKGKRIGVITHLGFKKYLLQHFPDLRVAHFYGQRGSNELADCDVTLVIGTPFPKTDDLERQAEALYWDEDCIDPRTVLEKRYFRTRGKRWSMRVRNYVDPRLQSLLAGKREEELLQAIFRARPLSVPPLRHEQYQLFQDESQVERMTAEILIYSNLPLPGLTVIVDAPRLDFQAIETAARGLISDRKRLTERKLAAAAKIARSKIRRWRFSLSTQPRQLLPHHPT